MAKKKQYTISDVISSQKKEDVEIPFKDGTVKLRILPVKYGEMKLFMRAKPGQDEFEQSDELLLRSVRKLEEDENGKIQEVEFEKDELSKLPPGFITSIMNEVNKHAGLTTDVEELKKLYGPMPKQEV